MEINKETLSKYIEAIRVVTDKKLFNLEDLSKLVENLLSNLPKLSKHLELYHSYYIDEDMLLEAVRHIVGDIKELDTINAFAKYTNSLTIDYRVITWMTNDINTILPLEEINKMIKDKNHPKFVMDNSHDFYLMYDTNIETNEYDFIEFKDSNGEDVNLDQIDLRDFSAKSFGMFLELDTHALDINTGRKYMFKEGLLQILSNGEYVPVYEVMSAKEIAELFSHRFEKGSAYED